jgi:hypothetical protein
LNTRLYTTKEVAEFLRSTPAGIRNLVYRGLLNPTRVGNPNLFTETEINRYLSSTVKNAKSRCREVKMIARQDYIARRIAETRKAN